jgi:protein dithiol oxidoreductase (disulfide-forming)
MKRRNFSATLLGASLGGSAWVATGPASAQGGPVEGTHYVRLGQPLPAPAHGKLEVVEFFWYGCPHCNEFEPTLEAWTKSLPADVVFRRAPVAFRPEPHGTHQRLYFAIEAMGLVATLHRRVFYAIHNERQSLDKPAEISAFVGKNGVDGAKFLEVFNSFSVQTKARQAHQLSEGYKIDGVPALGVQGRFYTSGSMAGSNDRSLAVVDHLLKRLRSGS